MILSEKIDQEMGVESDIYLHSSIEYKIRDVWWPIAAIRKFDECLFFFLLKNLKEIKIILFSNILQIRLNSTKNKTKQL